MAMTLRLSQQELDALRATAELEQRSMQEVAKQAIHEYTSRRTERRDEALARIVTEDARLLHRLSR